MKKELERENVHNGGIIALSIMEVMTWTLKWKVLMKKSKE